MSSPRHAARLLSAAALTSVLLSSCGGDDGSNDDGSPSDNGSPEAESLTVFAAASLSDTFTELGERFEEEHGAPVEFNVAGSSDLVTQLEQGAPADVFASADEANMDRAEDAGLLTESSELFASNTLVIATPPDNPADISSLQDLSDDDVVTVICAPQVPCGAATETVFDAGDVDVAPARADSAVTDVLGTVPAGEADAGLVYATDAQGAGDDVETVEFAEAEDAVNHYPIASLQDSENPLASEFVDFILEEPSQEVLREAGFASP